jgi:hypothetical protein
MTAAAAGTVGVLALAPSAEAKVVYTPTYAKLGPSFTLDLNHDGTMDAVFAGRASCVSGFSRSSHCDSSSQIGASVVGNELSFFGRVSGLRTGAQIGPNNQFIPYGNLVALSWQRSGTQYRSVKWLGSFANGGRGVRDRYVGIRFKIGGQIHYGWLRLSVSIPDASALKHTTILTGYAYETEPNQPIVAGATSSAMSSSSVLPQSLPRVASQGATLGALALGANGLALWRREEDNA